MSTQLSSLVGQKIEVKIEKLAVGGAGIARHRFLDRDIVIFIPETAPNDHLMIEVLQTEKTFLIGKIVEILKPSPSRRAPLCIVASECGGCSWQHVSDLEQLKQKELILTDLFNKFLKDIPYKLSPSIQGKKTFNYRNRIQLKQKDGRIGYFKKNSHEIVDISVCPIAEKAINDQFEKIRFDLKPTPELKKFELKIDRNSKFEMSEIGARGEGLAFSQVNNEINSLLTSALIDNLKKFSPLVITELFAGSGNFSFPIAEAFPLAQIQAVELSSELTKFAVEEVKRLKLQKKLIFFTADCKIYCQSSPLSDQMIIIDPPRSGCDASILEKISLANPQTLAYVSCHPVNLTRDLSNLKKQGYNFRIEYLQIFDMFPQTDHFETLCILVRN